MRHPAGPHHPRGLALVPVLALALLVLAACGGSSAHRRAEPRVTPPPGLAGTFQHYVALGDSYTAAPYVPVTDPSDPCLRSSSNYPSLIAESLRIEDFTDRSCGGATTEDLTGSQHPGVPPQFDALSSDTDLVTLGIGANNHRLSAVTVGSCPALQKYAPQGDPCRKSMQKDGRDVLLAAIPTIRQEVTTALRQIHARAPDARVVLVGYPRTAPQHGTCAELPLAAGDYSYVNEVTRKLDDALERAARATDSIWVDLWKPSLGHDICSQDPWINGAHADYEAAAAYHPFEREQLAVAGLVEQALAERDT